MHFEGTDNKLPEGMQVYGWIPFVIIVVISCVIAILYTRYFWHSRERDRFAEVVTIFGLILSIVTSALLPVDVYLVSYMKREDGTFKNWATNATRLLIENGVTYTYFTLYSMIILFIFFLLPLAYFAFEERDETSQSPGRFRKAICYAMVSVMFAVLLFITGAFLPYGKAVSNSTEWDILKSALNEVYVTKGSDALAFCMETLTVLGMLMLTFYTGFGLASFPVELIKGWKSLRSESEEISSKLNDLQQEITNLQAKVNNGSIKRSERTKLARLEEEKYQTERMQNQINLQNQSRNGILGKMGCGVKCIEVIFGILGMGVGFLLWISLLSSNINRAIHYASKMNVGYLLDIPKIPIPLDLLMVQCSIIFPLDCILYYGMILFLVVCTISAIRYLGINCCCLKMYTVRPHRTVPQGLILLCMIVMFSLLGLDLLMYFAIPQYTMFGNQHYNVYNITTKMYDVLPCSVFAPNDVCTMTRISSFIIQYAYKAPLFSWIYFGMSWLFLVVTTVAFGIVLCRGKKSYIREAVDPDDFEDSDDDTALLPA